MTSKNNNSSDKDLYENDFNPYQAPNSIALNEGENRERIGKMPSLKFMGLFTIYFYLPCYLLFTMPVIGFLSYFRKAEWTNSELLLIFKFGAVITLITAIIITFVFNILRNRITLNLVYTAGISFLVIFLFFVVMHLLGIFPFNAKAILIITSAILSSVFAVAMIQWRHCGDNKST